MLFVILILTCIYSGMLYQQCNFTLYYQIHMNVELFLTFLTGWHIYKKRHYCVKCKGGGGEGKHIEAVKTGHYCRCAGLASWPQGVSWLFEWTSLCLMLSVLGQTELWALYSSGTELSVSHSLKQSFSQLFLLFTVLPLHCLPVIWQQQTETGVSFNTGQNDSWLM